MSLRIRKNGKILCAAINEEKEGDIYISDALHNILCENKVIVTTENDYHMSHGGEWWWKGKEPDNVIIDKWWYE